MGNKLSKTSAKKVRDEVAKFKSNPLSDVSIDIKCKNETQKQLVNSIKNNTITFCEGSAGTGKTYVSLSVALMELKKGNYDKIVLIKSVTTLQDEEVGFLPGSITEKLTPTMYSFTGNIEKIVGKKIHDDLRTMGLIDWLPVAFMRGVSIDKSLIIIDEIQNLRIDNIRTILSRIGEGSKMILLGDVKQKDLKSKNNSALEFLIEHFKDIEGIGTIKFNTSDIIRHPIIAKFEDRFDELEKKGVIKGNEIVVKNK